MSDLLTSAIPDPEARAQAVRRRLEETGISGISPLNSNIATARPSYSGTTLHRSRCSGIHTITLSVIRREQRGFGASLGGEGSFAQDDFRQRGSVPTWHAGCRRSARDTGRNFIADR